MKSVGTRKTFSWETIEQPGDYFKIEGSTLIEECDGYDNLWEILQDVPGGLYCKLTKVRYQ